MADLDESHAVSSRYEIVFNLDKSYEFFYGIYQVILKLSSSMAS